MGLFFIFLGVRVVFFFFKEEEDGKIVVMWGEKGKVGDFKTGGVEDKLVVILK